MQVRVLSEQVGCTRCASFRANARRGRGDSGADPCRSTHAVSHAEQSRPAAEARTCTLHVRIMRGIFWLLADSKRLWCQAASSAFRCSASICSAAAGGNPGLPGKALFGLYCCSGSPWQFFPGKDGAANKGGVIYLADRFARLVAHGHVGIGDAGRKYLRCSFWAGWTSILLSSACCQKKPSL